MPKTRKEEEGKEKHQLAQMEWEIAKVVRNIH